MSNGALTPKSSIGARTTMRPNLKFLVGTIQRFLARYRICVRGSVYIRNQAVSVIARYLGESPDFSRDGEENLVQVIGKNCNIFVDVGANIGNWTELVLRNGSGYCRGLLFEPSGSCFQELKRRFGTLERIELINKALGAETGEIEFAEEPNCGATSSVIASLVNSRAETKRVLIATLDSEMYERKVNQVDIMKIDAEGFDFQVLKGASILLSEKATKIIQFEYGPAWAYASSTLAGALGFLKSFGYRVYLLRSDGLFDFNYPLYGEYFGYSNFVAVSPDAQSLIQPLCAGRI